MSQAWAIILGAGREQRLANGVDVAFLTLANRPAIAHLMCAAEGCADVRGLVTVVGPERLEMPAAMSLRFGIAKFRGAQPGAELRATNLSRALEAVDEEAEWVVVLEVCRPLVSSSMISDTLKAAAKSGAAAGAETIADPALLHTGKTSQWIEGRSSVWILRGPRVYRIGLLRKALAVAARKSADGDDEIRWVAKAGGEVRPVLSARPHLRLKTADDLSIAAHLLG